MGQIVKLTARLGVLIAPLFAGCGGNNSQAADGAVSRDGAAMIYKDGSTVVCEDGGTTPVTDAQANTDGMVNDSARVSVAVTAIKSGATLHDYVSPPTFSNTTNFAPGWINSGPPDYLKVTLTGIDLIYDDSSTVQLWTGSTELTLGTTGAVDVSTINAAVNPVPPGNIQAVRAHFSGVATIKGTLTANFNVASDSFNAQTETFCTKAAYAYDCSTGSGGATGYTAFQPCTSPSDVQETTVALVGANGSDAGAAAQEFFIETASSEVIAPSDTKTLTLLFDISRMLRFYDGLSPSSGPNPGDSSSHAYFFAHTMVNTFEASFFGAAGSIVGYDTFFSAHVMDHYEGVEGWMSIVYGASGNFLTGMLMGNDDNALTVAKGVISDFAIGSATDAGISSYDISYNIADGTVTGFIPATTITHYTDLATFTSINGDGEAYFQLQFKTP